MGLRLGFCFGEVGGGGAERGGRGGGGDVEGECAEVGGEGHAGVGLFLVCWRLWICLVGGGLAFRLLDAFRFAVFAAEVLPLRVVDVDLGFLVAC